MELYESKVFNEAEVMHEHRKMTLKVTRDYEFLGQRHTDNDANMKKHSALKFSFSLLFKFMYIMFMMHANALPDNDIATCIT